MRPYLIFHTFLLNLYRNFQRKKYFVFNKNYIFLTNKNINFFHLFIITFFFVLIKNEFVSLLTESNWNASKLRRKARRVMNHRFHYASKDGADFCRKYSYAVYFTFSPSEYEKNKYLQTFFFIFQNVILIMNFFLCFFC